MKPNIQETPNSRSELQSRQSIWLAALLLVLAGVSAYANSFNGPFVFDDVGTILNNPTLLKLWPPWDTIAGPPGGTTASGRPIVNLSLALNHALGGHDARGYHVFNLAIHLASGLTLFGVVRHTLLRERFASNATAIAVTCAALWLLHPLQTAAVTYVVQRAEVLASLFYLLTLYGFIRSTGSTAPARWQVISVASCLFGMASKEVAVSAPLFVFFYDRTLVSGSFAAAWRQRRGYYIALACTWLLLAALVVSTQGRGGSVGGDNTLTPWTYALTQCRAIVHYLRLAGWPSPLVFDYGTATISSPADVWPQALVLAALLSATACALWKRSPLGLAGLWFFALLAPSSSFVPIVTQTMAEHRMYLALAAVVVLVVTTIVRLAGSRSTWAFFGVAILFGVFSFLRNYDYRSAVSLWSDTATKLPGSKRAHNNLGTALFIEGRNDDAIATFKTALQLDSRYVSALVNLGRTQLQSNLPNEAEPNFTAALALEPANSAAHFGLGFIQASTGRLSEGIAHYREAVRLEPTATDYRLKLAQALFRAGEPAVAITEFRELVRQAPNLVAAHTGLGTVLASQKSFSEATCELTEALRLNPNEFDAHYNLGNVLVQQDRVADAITHYEAALRLRPEHAGVRQILEQSRAYLKSLP